MTDHFLEKIVLVKAGILRQTTDFAENDLLQKVHSDIVRGAAGAAIALVVGAVEILDLRVSLIEMKMKVAPAVGADQKPGKHAPFPVLRLTLSHLAALMLERYFDKDFDEEEKPKLLSFLSAIDVGIKDITVEKNKNSNTVYTYHMGKDKELYRFPLDIESDGTKRAIAIYSFVRIAVLYGKGLIIDEFNNQLHPLLQKYIIALFYEESKCGQLIYTTHDTSLMDKQFMRRDQIWFTSKNDFGETSLYSLAEFKIRNDKSFEKDYLGGIYGGIPILKDFSFKGE